ncbi:MAG TPA: hypothetical protein VF278_25180 [Pirellulales bacterium]
MAVPSQPQTIRDLLLRLAGGADDAAALPPPLIATALEERLAAPRKAKPCWAIVHSITDHGLVLLHERPFVQRHLTLRFQGPAGEVVRIVVAAAHSRSAGPLVETDAVFQRVGVEIRELT